MKVVSREEWTQARTALLVREKEFSREREALAQARRDLPWEEVTKDYVFDGPDGKLTLPDLFGDCGQLVVYHFMFPPEWDAGCPHCSFWADSFNGTLSHLRARDTSFAAVSRAPIGKITAYQRRMGWSFPWVSAGQTDFNYDFGISFTPEQVASHAPVYNYGSDPGMGDREGIGVFARDEQRPRVPHVLHLRARDRRDERRLPVPGSGPEGPRRTRGRRPAVLGPPPRRVRFLIPVSGCGS